MARERGVLSAVRTPENKAQQRQNDGETRICHQAYTHGSHGTDAILNHLKPAGDRTRSESAFEKHHISPTNSQRVCVCVCVCVCVWRWTVLALLTGPSESSHRFVQERLQNGA
eukprot:COSAG03_NODE_2274_length_2927_cov_2.040665_3_plen_113_part_00